MFSLTLNNHNSNLAHFTFTFVFLCHLFKYFQFRESVLMVVNTLQLIRTTILTL